MIRRYYDTILYSLASPARVVPPRACDHIAQRTDRTAASAATAVYAPAPAPANLTAVTGAVPTAVTVTAAAAAVPAADAAATAASLLRCIVCRHQEGAEQGARKRLRTWGRGGCERVLEVRVADG